MNWLRGISRKVIVLGWVSFFTDVASEMLYPLIPLFLTGTLGLPKEALGGIEGIAEGIATGLRWFGGVLSDWSGKRKVFVLWGYTLSAISKPILGLAAFFAGWPVFLAGRSADRLGKAIRTAARDALIADATEPEHRGAAFGMHRAMDTAGAVLGPLIALLVILCWPKTPLAYLFFLALVPGLMSAGLVAVAVDDSPHVPDRSAARERTHFWQHYSADFWRFLFASAIFSVGNSSDSLLLLRATELWNAGSGAAASSAGPSIVTAGSLIFVTGLYASFNVFFALLAAPVGRLSDRMSRKVVVGIGWLIYAGVYAGFAAGGPAWLPWALFAIYGVYQAFTDGVSKALVSDLIPSEKRAGAIGLYYSASGIGQLVASVLTGYLWQHVSAAAGFGVGAAFALAGTLALFLMRGVSANKTG